MKTTIRPLGVNVLVAPQKAEKKTSGGIYLPETANKEKPQQGVVIAIGDSKDIHVKKKDVVVFARYAGTEVIVDDETYLIVKNEDILAVVGA